MGERGRRLKKEKDGRERYRKRSLNQKRWSGQKKWGEAARGRKAELGRAVDHRWWLGGRERSKEMGEVNGEWQGEEREMKWEGGHSKKMNFPP